MTLGWTDRDLDVVDTLTRRVSLLAIEQIAEIWWPSADHLRIVRRRLRRLTTAELLRRTIVNVHPLLDLARPLVCWNGNAAEPNFERASQRARNRWTQPAIPTEVYSATRAAANLFGSTARQLPNLNHRDHDLLLAQVYVLYRTTRRTQARQWIGEDALPKAGYRIKDPDAFLVDDAGRVFRVIESAGHYGTKQIESFHQHCVESALPYELW